ncbi:MAG: rRNA cytosine-C5-methylase [Alphaproteobacteria bacterium]
MTPAARIAALVEIFDAVAGGRRPADEILRGYLRTRRFIGAKDRRAIGDDLYALLRRIVAVDRRLAGHAPTGRLRVAAWLAARDGIDGLAAAFSGDRYAPPPLDAEERAIVEAGLAMPLPDWAETNLPEWLRPAFVRRFGDGWPAEAQALNRPAPVDLRVNRLKASRDEAAAALARAGIAATPTPWSPDGLRVADRFVLAGLAPYKAGWFEPQDEASQLVALASGAGPGMTAIDLCAGAGGKTLALAALMGNAGRLVACDSEPDRLARLVPRAAAPARRSNWRRPTIRRWTAAPTWCWSTRPAAAPACGAGSPTAGCACRGPSSTGWPASRPGCCAAPQRWSGRAGASSMPSAPCCARKVRTGSRRSCPNIRQWVRWRRQNWRPKPGSPTCLHNAWTAATGAFASRRPPPQPTASSYP